MTPPNEKKIKLLNAAKSNFTIHYQIENALKITGRILMVSNSGRMRNQCLNKLTPDVPASHRQVGTMLDG